MAILVTGGAGYIGSHTVRLLSEQGRDVVVLDTMELGHPSAVVGAEVVVGDVGDVGLVSRVVQQHHIESVVHFAAYKAPGDSMRDPARYFSNNVGSTVAMLEALYRAGVGQVVFSSSCAVYGNPTVVPVTEGEQLRPESPYGESKAIVERILRWFDTCAGVRSVSLRYFNAAGASLDARIGEDWNATTNLLPLAIKAACGQRPPLQVFGTDYPTADGTALRDYIHVLDLAAAHARAVEYLEAGAASLALNVGTGRATSVKGVLAEIERVSGRPVPVEWTGRRPGDPVAIWADNTRARHALDWSPQYGLGDIVDSAWTWHTHGQRSA